MCMHSSCKIFFPVAFLGMNHCLIQSPGPLMQKERNLIQNTAQKKVDLWWISALLNGLILCMHLTPFVQSALHTSSFLKPSAYSLQEPIQSKFNHPPISHLYSLRALTGQMNGQQRFSMSVGSGTSSGSFISSPST